MAASVTAKVVLVLSAVAFSSARQFPDFVDVLKQIQSLNHPWNDADKVLSAANYQQWLESVDKNATLLQQLYGSNSSTQCWQDMVVWAQSLKQNKVWAMQSQCKLSGCV